MTHGSSRDEGSAAAAHLALQLRKLADQLELHQGVTCNVLCSAQEALSLCWEHRSLPKPCVELKEFLEQPPIQAEAELKLLRPNDESTMVGFILCHGHAEAVVKYRGEFSWKATREECHFMLAHHMGLGHVVAPCIALELNLLRPDLAPPTTILELLRQHTRLWQSAQEEHSSDTWPTNTWVTIEKCIHVNASSCGLSTLSAEGPAARLANFFGCIDLLQAYASTPAGKENGETAALIRDWYKEEATDEDFFEVLSRLDVRDVHELCAMACVALQRDGGPSNLMLRQRDSESFGLVSIDGTRVLGAFPSDCLDLFDSSEVLGPYTYWYPACLELPQADRPFDDNLATALKALDTDALHHFLQQHLGAAPGASQLRALAEATAACRRLQHIQQILREETPTARELCFRVVPIWRQDFCLPCRRSLVPLHAIEDCLQAEGTEQTWADERCAERWTWDENQRVPSETKVPAWDFF